MRIELGGSLILPSPMVLRFEANGTFNPQQYIDAGYTHFDVICIGAGGGSGGGVDTGTTLRCWGGAGGGGGFHRVRGLLSALPSSCPIVVGVGGSVGTSHASNPALTTDGSDGGFSTFNTNTCRASGGKGGKRTQTCSTGASTVANGGDGGAGNRIVAGGGGLGGVAGTPVGGVMGVPGTPGADGIFIYNNGRGGGGGAGGIAEYGTGRAYNEATAGGKGSYNPGDTSVYGPGEDPKVGPTTGALNVVPGGASGAKASPLTGMPTIFGQSKGDTQPGTNGVVVLRLTAE